MNETITEIMNNKNTAEQVMEIIPEVTKPRVDWGKVGVGVAVVGVIGALAAGVYYLIDRAKKADGEQGEATDNVKVAEHDFVDEEENEE